MPNRQKRRYDPTSFLMNPYLSAPSIIQRLDYITQAISDIKQSVSAVSAEVEQYKIENAVFL